MKNKSKKGYVIFSDIVWDIDGEDVKLPKQVKIPLSDFDDDFDFSNEGADFLSDKYGWIVESFSFQIDKTSK